jgi:hypothetical protein
LHGIEAGDSLPVLPACGGADFQVGGEIVATLVLREVGLAGRVPGGEAAVANALGEENLLAVVVIWLVGEDVFKGFGLALSLPGVVKSLVTLVVLIPWALGGARRRVCVRKLAGE